MIRKRNLKMMMGKLLKGFSGISQGAPLRRLYRTTDQLSLLF
jgi:hypothetical protein